MLPNADPEASEDLKAISGKSGQQADRGMVLPFEPLAMSFSHIWCADCIPLALLECLQTCSSWCCRQDKVHMSDTTAVP